MQTPSNVKSIAATITHYYVKRDVLVRMMGEYAPATETLKEVIAELVRSGKNVHLAEERLVLAFPQLNVREMISIEREVEAAHWVVGDDYLQPPEEDYVLV